MADKGPKIEKIEEFIPLFEIIDGGKKSNKIIPFNPYTKNLNKEIFHSLINFYDRGLSNEVIENKDKEQELIEKLIAEMRDEKHLLRRPSGAPQPAPEAPKKKEGITFDDIAGQPDAVNAAKMLAMQLNRPELFDDFGVDLPKGVLFAGPPGTGKTLIAKALANECGVPFKSVKASEILSKWFGESTQNIGKVFEELRAQMQLTGKNNGILYIDEIDALAQSRDGGSSHQETTRMLSEFLQQIDGFATKSGIIVIASTNKPDAVDPAFLSRMEMTVEVPLPNRDGLVSIMGLLFTKASVKAKRNLIARDVDFARIADQMTGYSGRDIESVVKTTLRLKALKGDPNAQITEQDIMAGLRQTGIQTPAQTKMSTRRRIGFVGGEQD